MAGASDSGARSALGRALRPWAAPPWLAIANDPYLFYTASLVPIVLAVAWLARRPGELPLAIVLSTLGVGTQAVLGVVSRRRRLGGSVRWQLLRLLVPLAFVAIASRLVGGPALPLIALYIPVVAAAAAAGTVQGATTAVIAAVALLGPELLDQGSGVAVPLRAVTLAGVALVLAFGTRRIVRVLEDALSRARAAVRAERGRARQIGALDAVGRLLAAEGPTTDTIARVLDVVVGHFGYSHVSLYTGDERLVRLAAQRGYPDALRSFDASTGVAGRAMRSRELVFVPDVASDPDYVSGTVSATSLICAPLVVGGQFLGILNVESVGERRLDATDRSVVSIMASRIAGAIALGRDRQALAARAELFRSIEAFGREVTSSLAIQPLAEMIVDATAKVVAADGLAVTLLDRSDGRYWIRAVRGWPSEAVGRSVQPGEGLAGRAIRDRSVVVATDDLGPESFPSSLRDLDIAGLAHGVALPLIRDGVVVGALTIGRTDEDEPFRDLEVEGLQLLASSAALAVANAFLHAEVRELAIRDPLTGLANRRHFDEALDRLIAAHRRGRLTGWRPLSVIVFDLDRFGAFNKQHGHQVGDDVLRTFANVLRARFRGSDLIARLGGEEFVAVLDDADREAAVAVADEVRALLAAREVRAMDGSPLRVTVSAGCAELDQSEPTREALLKTADVALFMAKRAGRDRVVAA